MPLDSTGPKGSHSHTQEATAHAAAATGTGNRNVGVLAMPGRQVSVAPLSNKEKEAIKSVCDRLLAVRKDTDPNDLQEKPCVFRYVFVPLRQLWRDEDSVRATAAMNGLAELYPYRRDLPPDAWFSVFVLMSQIHLDRHVELLGDYLQHARVSKDLEWNLDVLQHWIEESSHVIDRTPVRRLIFSYLTEQWRGGLRSQHDLVGFLIGNLLRETWADIDQKHVEWVAAYNLLPNIAAEGGALSEGGKMIAAGLIIRGGFLDQWGRHGTPFKDLLRARIAHEFERAEESVDRLRARANAFCKEQDSSSLRGDYEKLVARYERPAYQDDYEPHASHVAGFCG